MKRNRITVKEALKRGLVTQKQIDGVCYIYTPAQVVALVLSEREDERMDRETYSAMTDDEREAHDNR